MGIKKRPTEGLPSGSNRANFSKHAQGSNDQWTGANSGDGAAQYLCTQLHSLPASQVNMASLRMLLQGCTSRMLASVFKRLEHRRSSHRAFEVFNLLRALPQGDPLASLCDQYTYSAMMSQCTRPKGYKAALKMLSEMKERGIERNLHTYSSLMSVCLRAEKAELALKMYHDLLDEGLVPCLVTYHTLMDIYGHMGQWEKSIEILDIIVASGMQPDVRTFNIAIIACGRCNQLIESIRVFERLLDSGARPCVTTYTSLMSLFCRMGQMQEGMLLLEAMQRGGVHPNVITYSALINGCANSGDLRSALFIFDKMRELKCQPSVVTYNTLLKACGPEADWRTAMWVWSHMQSMSCRPDIVSFRSLLSVMHSSGRWPMLLDVYVNESHADFQNCRIVAEKVLDTLWCTGAWDARISALQLFRQSDAVSIEAGPPSPAGDMLWHGKVHLPGPALCMLLSWLEMLSHCNWRADVAPPPPPLPPMSGPRGQRPLMPPALHPSQAAARDLAHTLSSLRLGGAPPPPPPPPPRAPQLHGPSYAAQHMLLSQGLATTHPATDIWGSSSARSNTAFSDSRPASDVSNVLSPLALGNASAPSNDAAPANPSTWPLAYNSASEPHNVLPPAPPGLLEGGFTAYGNMRRAMTLHGAESHLALRQQAADADHGLQQYHAAPRVRAGQEMLELRLKLSKLGEQPLETMVEQVREEIERLEAPLVLHVDGHMLSVTARGEDLERWFASPRSRAALELPVSAAERPQLVAADPSGRTPVNASLHRILEAQQKAEDAIRTAIALESTHYPLTAPEHGVAALFSAVAALEASVPETSSPMFWSAQQLLLLCMCSRHGSITLQATNPAGASPPPALAADGTQAEVAHSHGNAAAPAPAADASPAEDGDDDNTGSSADTGGSTVGLHMPTFDLNYRARGVKALLRARSHAPGAHAYGHGSSSDSSSSAPDSDGAPLHSRSSSSSRSTSSVPHIGSAEGSARTKDAASTLLDGDLMAPGALHHSRYEAPSATLGSAKAGTSRPLVPGYITCSSATLSAISNDVGSSAEANEVLDTLGSSSSAAAYNAARAALHHSPIPPPPPADFNSLDPGVIGAHDGVTVDPEVPPPPGLARDSAAFALANPPRSIATGNPNHNAAPVLSIDVGAGDGLRPYIFPPDQHNLLRPSSRFPFNAIPLPPSPLGRSNAAGASARPPAAPANGKGVPDGALKGAVGAPLAPAPAAPGRTISSLVHVCSLVGISLATGTAVCDTLPELWDDADQDLLLEVLNRVANAPMGHSLWRFCDTYISAISPGYRTEESENMRAFVKKHIATVGLSSALLAEPPSLLAAALVTCARAHFHLWPEWPQTLVSMTGYALTQPGGDAPTAPFGEKQSPLLLLTTSVAMLVGLKPFAVSNYELGRAVGPDRALNRLAAVPVPEHNAVATRYLISVLQKAALC